MRTPPKPNCYPTGLCLSLFVFIWICHPLTAQVYVDLNATGASNGTSWADAYTDLQTALTNTNSGEIWVAAGIYYPTNCLPCGTTDREISFELKNNVALYGGFAGNETALNQRNFNANLTILSGDIGGAGNADNTLQVVRATNVGSSAVLDGFIVEGGNADGAGNTGTNFGGGITLDGSFSGISSPAIQNCTIRNNTASGGGGMAIYCTAGGTSAALVNNCTFDNNTASLNSVSFGGGVIIIGSTGAQITAQFSNCTFTNNFTGTSGDGAALAATPSGSLLALQVTNCVFDGNTSSDRAGAVLVRVSDSSIGQGENQSVFSNCTFTNNSATGEAGAVYDRASFGAVGQTQYINCQFTGNTSGERGGALFLRGSQASQGQVGINNAVIQGCTFQNNTAGQEGGAVFVYGWRDNSECNPNFQNNTITNNTATLEGGGVYVFAEDMSNANPVFTNNTITGNASTMENGGGIGFRMETGSTGSLTISGGSISNNTAQTFGAGIYYILPAGSGASGDFQLANCTLDGNSVQGGGGALFMNIQEPVTITPVIGGCTISNNMASQSSVSFAAGLFFTGSSGAKVNPQISGCTFTGNINVNNDGGAMAASFSDTNNSGTEYNALIEGCTFTDNVADDRCAGIYQRFTGGQHTTVIRNCTFTGNTSGGNGTAIYDRASFNAVSNTQIINCRFINNSMTGNPAVPTSEDGGGAIYIRGSQNATNRAVVANCLFENNSASPSGGAIYCSGALNGANTGTCEPEIVNNTFYGNSAGSGSGLYAAFADPFIANNIFWDGGNEIAGNNHDPTISDCIIEGGYNGPGTVTNVLTDDPLFVDPDNSNFRLTACSPAVNAGDNASIPDDLADMDDDNNTTEAIPIDLDGQARISAATVDMGAYERPGGGSTLDLTIQTTNVTCNGVCNGEATAGPVGGTPNFSFLWSDGQTTATATGLCAGLYTVTITDGNGCTAEQTVTIADDSGANPLALDAGADDAICSGASATLNASASGGAGNYAFAWDNSLGSGANQTVSPVATTTYTVTVTDDNSCTATDVVTVTVNDGPTPAISGDLSFCTGASTTLDAGIFTSYSWSNNATTQTIDVSSPGDYTVTVSDDNGCEGSDQVTVTEIPLPQPVISGELDFCAGASTTLDAGSFAAYNWSNNATTQTITVSSPGNYTVTVTDDDSCMGSTTVSVSELPLPAPAISGELDICPGVSTTLDAGVFDIYAWSTNATTQTISVSTPGDYSVTVTDTNGCTGSDQVTVNEIIPPAPTISGDLDVCPGLSTTLDAGVFDIYAWSTNATTQTISVSTPGDYSVTVTDTNGCTGSDQVTVNGIIPPAPTISGDLDVCPGLSTTLDAGNFTAYIWSTNATTQTISVSTPGDYSVTVTDTNGCTGSDQVTVGQLIAPSPAIDGDLSFCAAQSTTLDAGLYNSYIWSTNATTQTISVSTPGDYSVTVTDTNGCTGSDQVTVSELPAPLPVITGTSSFCTGESTVLDGGSFTAYSWSTNETTQTITVSTSGPYSITVTDANGCTGSDQITVTELPAPTPTITGDLEFCEGETTALDAGSFTTYLWSTNNTSPVIVVNSGGIYSVTVTDANGCTGNDQVTVTEHLNPQPQISGQLSICFGSQTVLDAGAFDSYLWSNDATTQTITVDAGGNYSVTVTNANGCTGEDLVTVSVNDNLQPQIAGPDLLCSGSTIQLDAGVFDTYQWSNNETSQVIDVTNPGTYSVTVTDINGCTGMDAATISEVPSPTPEIQGQFDFCSGQFAVIGVSNVYDSYLWSNSATEQTITVTTGGIYNVTVTDDNDCQGIAGVSITENPSPLPQITGEFTICSGESTVLDAGAFSSYLWSNDETTQTITVTAGGAYSVTVTNTGGCEGTDAVVVSEATAPEPAISGVLSICDGESTVLDAGDFVNYLWSTNETTPTITVEAPGDYSVTVTNAEGCSGNDLVTVTASPSPQPQISGQLSFCPGNATQIDAGNFATYLWSTNETTQTIAVDTPGDYSVTVTNTGGCTGEDLVSIIENPAPDPSINGVLSFCEGASTTLDAGDFTAYLWSTDETASSIEVSAGGDYSVTVTDANGCEGEDMVNVMENSLPSPQITGQLSICTGTSTTLGAGAFDNYLWSTNEITPTITVATGGDYGVTVTDANGCEGSDLVSVTENDNLQPQITGILTICDGNSTQLDAGIFDNYLWSTNETSQTITVDTPGDYGLTVTDANGCTGADTITVSAADSPAPVISGATSFCDGASTQLEVGDFDSYLWSTNETTATIEVTTGGAYSVTVTNEEGCIGTDQVTVSALAPPAPTINGEQEFCTGASTTLDAGAFDNYLWSTNETTQTINVTQPGTYSVTVSDENGCTGEDQVSVSENDSLDPQITGQLAFCTGASTTLDAGAFDNYLWSTNETTQTINVTQPGTYSVTVSDENGCTGEDQVSVSENDSLDPQITGQLAFCTGASTTLDAGAFDSYLWSTNETTQTINVTQPGTYSVTVSDENGCEGTDTVSVSENDSLDPQITGQLAFCTGASTTLDAGAFDSYLWSTNETTQTINVTQPGTYSVTVSDENGCEGTDTVSVSENDSLDPQITGQLAFCTGASTTLDAGAFDSYLWSTNETTQTINVTQPGTYSVTVSDENGCTGEDQVSVSENDSLDPQISGQLAFCTGASTTLDAGAFDNYLWSTNETTQTINVTQPGTYSVTVSDNNGCEGTDTVSVSENDSLDPQITGQLAFCTGASTTLDAGAFDSYLWSTNETTQTINVTQPGTYSVTVSDENGCTGEDQVSVSENDSLDPQISGQLAFCTGASTTLDAGAFDSYLWSTNETTQTINVTQPGIYSVTVSDENGCEGTDTVSVSENDSLDPQITGQLAFCTGASTTLDAGAFDNYLWSTNETTQTINVTQPGTYSVTVSDNNGCEGTDTVSVSENDNLDPQITGQLAFCTGASTTLDAGAFDNYLWSTNETTQTINVTQPGTYSVTVSDENGCTGEDQVSVSENDSLDPQITGQLAFCTGASTTLDAGAFDSYLWSTNETTQTINVTQPGTYSVTVSDENGCEGTDTVSVSENDSLDPQITGQLAFCTGASTTLDAGAFDSYLWSTNETTQTINVTQPGTYSVTVSDNNGCEGTDSVSVSENDSLDPQITGVLRFCEGEETVLSTGEFAAYEWSTGAATPDITVFNEGTYEVTVTDADGCSGAAAVEVRVDLLPAIDAGPDINLQTGESIQLLAVGAVDYLWLPADHLSCADCPDPVASPEEDITYVVTGTDENGCRGQDELSITLVNSIEEVIDPVNVITPNGDGVNDEFLIRGLDQFPDHNLTVFNRWGDTVFETVDYENDWEGVYNGRPLPAGTYLFVLVVENEGQKVVVRSTLTIIRE